LVNVAAASATTTTATATIVAIFEVSSATPSGDASSNVAGGFYGIGTDCRFVPIPIVA
jgi:hypothetical protein